MFKKIYNRFLKPKSKNKSFWTDDHKIYNVEDIVADYTKEHVNYNDELKRCIQNNNIHSENEYQEHNQITKKIHFK
jgi:hypothetical protein